MSRRISEETFRRHLHSVATDRCAHPRDIMNGKGRRGIVGEARHELMWRIQQVKTPSGEGAYSLREIARVMNLGDHTSALHGIRAHEKRLAEQ